jgi:hypothetical protein
MTASLWATNHVTTAFFQATNHIMTAILLATNYVMTTEVWNSRCDRNLKSGTQCNTCGCRFHNNCGNIKAQVTESGKWICGKWRSERLRLLQEKLQNALLLIDDLTSKNNALGEQLWLATTGRGVGRWDTVPGDHKGGECLVLGDLIICNVGSECLCMKVESFLGIRTEQLHRVTENRDLGNPDNVIIHVGTNNLRWTGNLDYVMGDVYDLVNIAKIKFSTSRVVLSGLCVEARRVLAAYWSLNQQIWEGSVDARGYFCRPK